MKEYLCKICGYIYNPNENNNIPFDELPQDWVCPLCFASKENFEELN